MKWLIGGAAAALVVAGVVVSQWESWVTIPSKREPLLAALTDPDSVKFRGDRLSHYGAVCGEFNARNSHGGYAGYKRYFVHGDLVAVRGEWPPRGAGEGTAMVMESLDMRIAAKGDEDRIEQEKRRRFDARWKELCSG